MGGGGNGRRAELSAQALAAALLIGLSAPATAGVACDPNEVVLYPAGGPEEGVRFEVEIADDPAEQARGLMYRTEMPPDAGMIFVFDRPRPARFWMKNTVLPLDMLFIDDAGRVVNVAERTIPFSERTWRSDGPVRAVLEINGGLAAEHGIGPGTPARHPAFEAAEPEFACAG